MISRSLGVDDDGVPRLCHEHSAPWDLIKILETCGGNAAARGQRPVTRAADHIMLARDRGVSEYVDCRLSARSLLPEGGDPCPAT